MFKVILKNTRFRGWMSCQWHVFVNFEHILYRIQHVNVFNPFMCNVEKMIKHTLKILRCARRKIFKVCWPFFNIIHEKVNQIISSWVEWHPQVLLSCFYCRFWNDIHLMDLGILKQLLSSKTFKIKVWILDE